MGDYTKRDDALDALCTGCDICKRLEIDIKDKCDWYEAIKRAPAADVVEVVRCEDCENCEIEVEYGLVSYYACDVFGSMVEPDGYCNYGKRRGDKHE